MQAKMIRIFPTQTSWCFPATPFFSGELHQNTAKWMRHTCADKIRIPHKLCSTDPSPSLGLHQQDLGSKDLPDSALCKLDCFGITWTGQQAVTPLQTTPVPWCNGIIPCLSSPPSLQKKNYELGAMHCFMSKFSRDFPQTAHLQELRCSKKNVWILVNLSSSTLPALLICCKFGQFNYQT